MLHGGESIMADNEFYSIIPEVSPESEFFEILNDFSDPLEIIREAISNSVDWGATFLRIKISIEQVDGERTLIIRFEDNGSGMTKSVIEKDFWGLGFSKSKGDATKIGEKGHGTKIYLRSRKLHVRTQSQDGAFEAICSKPLANLSQRKLHEPKIRQIDNFTEAPTGTEIVVFGYNGNKGAKFIQPTVKDYLLWFTKHGSVELEFNQTIHKDFKVYLQCIGTDEFEEISFGHRFPPENSSIVDLFDELGAEAADSFVKRYMWEGNLIENPDINYQAVIYVEGDDAKQTYNPMIRRRSDKRTGAYRVADRYGVWLCKDYIPIENVNSWITGFGSGSNAFVLLHGFVNCQQLDLTANRGNISNTDPQILDELKKIIVEHIEEVDQDLKKKSLYILRNWQQEQRTLAQEEADFDSRIKLLGKKKTATIDGHILYEPFSESEVFGIFITLITLHSDLFEFTPIDYNTNRGIDIIAKNKGRTRIREGEYGYVELKYILRKDFNHAFEFLKWIVCWDFHESVKEGISFIGVEEDDERNLVINKDADGHPIYFLEKSTSRVKIQIIKLKELLENKLSTKFD
jgi:hypothetical protein